MSAPRYMPQLDALRAFAVLAVMVHHYRIDWAFGWPFGAIGVQLFFVLSGFLITGILLRSRDAAGVDGRWQAIRNFYVRRFLRIFPLFYMTLALAWLAGITEVRDYLPWHLLYASNILFARIGYFQAYVSHFWSLAVEEQFYLVWPFLMLFVPRRMLLRVLVAAAVTGPVFRLSGGLSGLYSTTAWMWFFSTPFANLDSLAIGGLLAYFRFVSDERPAYRTAFIRVALVAGLALLVPVALTVHHVIAGPRLSIFRLAFETTTWALLGLVVIDRAADGVGGWPGRILEFKPLVYLGRISYGLYVIHLFVPMIVTAALTRLGLDPIAPGPVAFWVWSLATIALASLSWQFFERPLNGLKDRISPSGVRKESLGVAIET